MDFIPVTKSDSLEAKVYSLFLMKSKHGYGVTIPAEVVRKIQNELHIPLDQCGFTISYNFQGTLPVLQLCVLTKPKKEKDEKPAGVIA